ncbi:hypothetical protein [Brevundimonas phoenicis]|uniref:hypothetical protein n=1 Tax=unclassified Brevundimonas TaxID=2622653 RepID=UPI0039A0B4FB
MNLNDFNPETHLKTQEELVRKVADLETQVASLIDVVAILLADGDSPLINRLGSYPHLNAGVVKRETITQNAQLYLASRS